MMQAMLEQIRQLATRYRALMPLVQHQRDWQQQFTHALASLTIAEVLLTKADQTFTDPRPINLVVMGPTQSGKSSAVNALLPLPLAEVSALAGHTIHPQAFAVQSSSISSAWLTDLFPDYAICQTAELSRDDVTQLAFNTFTEPAIMAATQNVFIWDSPDFDSVDAAGYSDSVLRTIALADLHLLVVSKEKYADQRVWDMLSLIAPLNIPLVVCINKTRAADAETLQNSFLRRYASQFNNAAPQAVITLPFVETAELPAEKLRNAVEQQLANLTVQATGGEPQAANQNTQRSIQGFIDQHQADWLQPIKLENLAVDAWRTRLEDELDQFSQRYRQEYLDHPHYYDTFQRALAELLKLLEVPGVAGKLGQAREIVTWPVRTLFKTGKDLFRRRSEHVVTKDQDYETNLVLQLSDHTITRMIELAMQQASDDQPGALWQEEVSRRLHQSQSRILASTDAAMQAYQAQFEAEIQHAADRLYEKLQQQPALLNGLRAARVSVDAAAVVLALKTGGISMNDFILAPAMLSLSSMLMESSLGQYLNKVKADLKVQQLAKVQQIVLAQLHDELDNIRKESMQTRAFGVDIQTLGDVA